MFKVPVSTQREMSRTTPLFNLRFIYISLESSLFEIMQDEFISCLLRMDFNAIVFE